MSLGGGEVPAKSITQFLRTRLRFRVRTLIVFALACGGVFGYIVHFLRSAERQRIAVAAIRKVQGGVEYDRHFEANQFFANGEFHIPRWLVRRIGDDYLANVTQVSLPDSATDLDLSQVANFPKLEVLGQRSARLLSGEGLKHLKGLSAIRMLNLQNTNVNDAGLVHLSGMTGLRYLDLDHTQVSDAGLMHLQHLTGLETLKLEGTQVTDAGLAHVKRLGGLQRLVLRDTKISDSGLVNIEALPRLEYLDVTKTSVTRSGMELLMHARPKLTIRGY
jgi:hypothetical protein